MKSGQLVLPGSALERAARAAVLWRLSGVARTVAGGEGEGEGRGGGGGGGATGADKGARQTGGGTESCALCSRGRVLTPQPVR